MLFKISPSLSISPQTPMTPVTPATPMSPMDPEESGKEKSVTKMASASAISGGLGRRPPSSTGAKKKGLGGAGIKKVGMGSVKVTTGPVPEEVEAEKPAVSSSGSASTIGGDSSVRRGPDISGFGSAGPAKEEPVVSVRETPKHYNKTGPDFGGMSSSGAAAPTSSGLDISDVAWSLGQKSVKASAALSQKMDQMSVSIKGFLDDL
eukprot:TRINITY_DN8537_c0_g1_i1.p1 TRINITY_DN8537_c0_g1~~TRINITY_DN8537_c0_g1_i1.p1  ORF type:complete len:206 (-),score=30.29 TRINITY_DN8537_c0_g1_i1:153-770(-)